MTHGEDKKTMMTGANNAQRRVLDDIRAERARQDERWGEQAHLMDRIRLRILGEEIGESARVITDVMMGTGATTVPRGDLLRVAAVAVAWLEGIYRRHEAARQNDDSYIKHRPPPCLSDAMVAALDDHVLDPRIAEQVLSLGRDRPDGKTEMAHAKKK